MARIARIVAPDLPYHVTQRGNRREETFFCEGDYRAYLSLMAEWCGRRGVEVWAYCPMPNHVHLIAVPRRGDTLRRHERTGRPLGEDGFVSRLEGTLGRVLRRQKPGPKPRQTPREVWRPPNYIIDAKQGASSVAPGPRSKCTCPSGPEARTDAEW